MAVPTPPVLKTAPTMSCHKCGSNDLRMVRVGYTRDDKSAYEKDTASISGYCAACSNVFSFEFAREGGALALRIVDRTISDILASGK